MRQQDAVALADRLCRLDLDAQAERTGAAACAVRVRLVDGREALWSCGPGGLCADVLRDGERVGSVACAPGSAVLPVEHQARLVARTACDGSAAAPRARRRGRRQRRPSASTSVRAA